MNGKEREFCPLILNKIPIGGEPITCKFTDKIMTDLPIIFCVSFRRYLPYCSSDCWSGTRAGRANFSSHDLENIFKSSSWFGTSKKNSEMTSIPFSGYDILTQVIENLVTNHGLTNGHSLILAGSRYSFIYLNSS